MQTIDEVRQSKKDFLTPSDIAPILKCAVYSINTQAKQDRDKLGFPVIMLGNRVKIPRQAFLAYFDGNSNFLDAVNAVSEFLQNSGFEEASKAVDCHWDL